MLATELQQIHFFLVNTWQVSSLLFVDSPVGAGYSYAEKEEDYVSNDSTTVADLYDFLNRVRNSKLILENWNSGQFS